MECWQTVQHVYACHNRPFPSMWRSWLPRLLLTVHWLEKYKSNIDQNMKIRPHKNIPLTILVTYQINFLHSTRLLCLMSHTVFSVWNFAEWYQNFLFKVIWILCTLCNKVDYVITCSYINSRDMQYNNLPKSISFQIQPSVLMSYAFLLCLHGL